MPKSTWEQSSARRWTMQGVMALVFVGTLGLAAIVDRNKAASAHVELGDAVVEGGVSVRLPRGWAVVHEVNPETGRFLFAAEKGRARGTRTISIYRHRPDRLMAPMEYLSESGIVDSDKPELPKEFGGQVGLPEVTGGWSAGRVSGFPGVVWRMTYAPLQTQYDIPELKELVAGMMPKQIVGATVLPSRRAVAVKLSGTGPIEPADTRLLHDVLDSLILLDEKAPTPDDTTTRSVDLLPVGATVGAPPVARVRVPVGFVEAPSRSTLSTSRVLLGLSTPLPAHDGVTSEETDRQWETIELTPLTLAPSADAGRVSGMLALNHLVWAGATVTDESPVGDGRRVWRADPAKSEADYTVARRAYVVAEVDGRGVLVMLNLPRDSADRLDPLWHALLPTITFPGTSEVDMLARHGQIEAARFMQRREQGTNPKQAGARWWLRTRAGEDRGWSSDSSDASGRAGKSAARTLEWNGHVSAVQTIWSSEGSSSYQAARRFDDMDVPTKRVGPEGSDQSASSSRVAGRMLQQVIVEPSRLVTSLKGTATAREEGKPPADFIPAPFLAQALARAEALPMSIQTDARPGREEVAVPTLVRMNVRPDTTSDVKTPDGGKSLLVELDGTGQAQKWTFDPAGALVQIDYADGTKRSLGTEADVRFLAQRDKRMSP